jgi:hypothetical protein
MLRSFLENKIPNETVVKNRPEKMTRGSTMNARRVMTPGNPQRRRVCLMTPDMFVDTASANDFS